MLQINASRAPSNLPAAGTGPDSLPGDGFEALLAGLLGIAVAPLVPVEPARPLVLAPATPPDPDADAEAADSEHAPADDGADDQAPLARSPGPAPARPLELAAGPAAASPAPAPAETAPSDELPPRAERAEPSLRAPLAPVPGAVDRPADRSSAGPIEPPRPTAERPAPVKAKAGRAQATTDGTPPVAPNRADAASRLLHETAASGAMPADRPSMLGPLVAGGGGTVTHLTLQVDRPEPAALEVGRALPPLAAGPAPLDPLTTAPPGVRPAAAGPVPQLAAAIERAVGGEVQRLTVQLSPQALGSIEIALEVDPERRLAVVILVERPETLELLRGEARELQRLLAQQGIDLADAGLELGLMDGERRGRQQPAEDDAPDGEAADEPAELAALALPDQGAGLHPLDPGGRAGRLNLSI